MRVRRAATGIVKSYQTQFNTSQIFLSSSNIPVYWAHISVIDAELICISDLLKLSRWKYVVTTAGSELPIHSHRKIRADLEATDGQDVFVSFPFPYRHYERFNETHEMMR